MTGERFTVVRHHDVTGTWYRVVDQQQSNATISAWRSQAVAHRCASEANSGWRVVRSRGTRTSGRVIERPV